MEDEKWGELFPEAANSDREAEIELKNGPADQWGLPCTAGSCLKRKDQNNKKCETDEQ